VELAAAIQATFGRPESGRSHGPSQLGPNGTRRQNACAAILKAPRPAILGVKEYVKTAPDMAVFGAVEFARSLHATVNSSREMRKKT